MNINDRAINLVKKIIINGAHDLDVKYQFECAVTTMIHSLEEFKAEVKQEIKEGYEARIKDPIENVISKTILEHPITNKEMELAEVEMESKSSEFMMTNLKEILENETPSDPKAIEAIEGYKENCLGINKEGIEKSKLILNTGCKHEWLLPITRADSSGSQCMDCGKEWL